LLRSGVDVEPGRRDEFLAVVPVVADGVLVPVVGQVAWSLTIIWKFGERSLTT
jgi:hypothetical protein